MKTRQISAIAFALFLSVSGSGLSAASGDTPSTGRSCTFGKYGTIVVYSGGRDKSYLVVNGKKHPFFQGNGFLQAEDDDNIILSVDRFNNLYYLGKVRGRNCRIISHQ